MTPPRPHRPAPLEAHAGLLPRQVRQGQGVHLRLRGIPAVVRDEPPRGHDAGGVETRIGGEMKDRHQNANTEIHKEFCPNCEAEVPCTHEAELFVCDICGEDFAKYIVSRYCNVSDVSMTQDVLTSIKTGQSIENANPDYYKDELYLDEDFRMLAKTFPADVSTIGVTTLIDYVEAVEAELAHLKEENHALDQINRDIQTAATHLDEVLAILDRKDKELAELNDRAVFIQFENEDELPADISGNVYDVMFRCSHVDGVRLFPYIEENGQKYYLVMLREDE